jgi:hypothetical protein
MGQFKIMSSRSALGGISGEPAATRDAILPRDSSLPRDFLFPRGDFLQTVIDIATVIFCALFVTVTGVGLAAAVFILLFVKV